MSRLHHLLLEIIPGGAKKNVFTRRRGKARRLVAAERIGDLERIPACKKAANKELTALLKGTGTMLMDLPVSIPPPVCPARRHPGPRSDRGPGTHRSAFCSEVFGYREPHRPAGRGN